MKRVDRTAVRMNGVRRERSRLKDILTDFSAKRLLIWLKTRSWVGTLTVGAREAKPARGSHQRKPPKPKGLALFQGRWRPTQGVTEVRARSRGPGHHDATRVRREHHHGTHLQGGA